MPTETKLLWIFITFHLLAWILSLFFSFKWRGMQKAIRFFVPSLLAAFALEAAGVWTGKYQYPRYPFSISIHGYHLPIIIMIGWSNTVFFLKALSQRIVSHFGSIRHSTRLFFIAVTTGLAGVVFDLFLDPLANALGWWSWPNPNHEISFHGVPVTNFSVWFVFLFFMSLFLDLVEERKVSDSRKFIQMIFGLPIAGLLMLVTQLLFRAFFNFIGWI